MQARVSIYFVRVYYALLQGLTNLARLDEEMLAFVRARDMFLRGFDVLLMGIYHTE